MTRTLASASCLVALAVAPLSSAAADEEDEQAAPSRADVRDARQQVAVRADQVGQIQAQLALAQQRLREVQVASMQATEAYNGAVYALQQARATARAAQRRAERADRVVERQRRALEGFAVSSASHATSISDLGIVLSSDGPQQLLQDYRAWTGTTSALQADLDRWDASRAVAAVLTEQAETAMARQADAADAARAARADAQEAVAVAASQEESIQSRTAALVRSLARAQQVTVRLARQHQEAAQQEAAELAAAEAAAQAAQEAAAARAREQAATEEAVGDRPAETPQSGAAQPATGGTGADAGGDAAADPTPPAQPVEPTPAQPVEPTPAQPVEPPQPTGPAPPSPGGAAAAIAFAKAQLGEPYVYGAAGPDSWDCSGLTSQAWAAAGRPLSHWSVAQYAETTPITQAQLQPGDLAFWSNGSPDSIYHVAMYLGDGLIIQAPRPGRGVEIVSLYYWITPDLFGRV